MIKCIVIDDEQSAINELIEFINYIPKFQITSSFTNPLEAFNYLKENEVIDLVFMDVDMPLINGIELSNLMRHKIKKLVFTTSYPEYALDAFKIDADDFLLKPFGFSDFFKTVEKLYPAQITVNRSNGELSSSQNSFFYVKNKEDSLKLVKVEFDEIEAIESLLNYIRIHTKAYKLVTHISLKEIKLILSEREEFIQLHRSFIISKRHISIVDGNTITVTSGSKFTVGDSYREALNEHIKSRILKPAPKKE